MLPQIMNGGPLIYDGESKKFVMRPSAEPQRKPLADLKDDPEEPSLPPPGAVRPQPPRERQKLIVWLASASLFLIWLILLTIWTRRISSRMDPSLTPSIAPSQPIAAELRKEDFSR